MVPPDIISCADDCEEVVEGVQGDLKRLKILKHLHLEEGGEPSPDNVNPPVGGRG